MVVFFWTAGFDIIYAMQDEEFDKEHGLYSIPAMVGKEKALWVSWLCHLNVFQFLTCVLIYMHVGPVGFLVIPFAAAMLIYEQSLVKPNDLSRVNFAFFTLNGCISVGVFLFLLVDRVIRR